jgi:hypothetical protein
VTIAFGAGNATFGTLLLYFGFELAAGVKYRSLIFISNLGQAQSTIRRAGNQEGEQKD